MAQDLKYGIESESVSADDDSRYMAINLTMLTILPMAMKAFTELGIADILAGGKKPMTAEEIVAKLPTKSAAGAARNLRRLLRPLVREGVLSQSLNEEDKTVYGLTEISKWFTSNIEFSALPYARLNYCSDYLALWSRMKEVILDDSAIPFEAQHGMPFFDYTQKDAEFMTKFHDGMLCVSQLQFKEVVDHLQHSGILEGVNTFVDVGGGRLAPIVGYIVAQNPHIQGINFDLPEIIATAPPLKGVEHVGGNFFKSVPTGDAIFMKLILHALGDDEAMLLLKNCFKALPTNGKVILAEYVLNEGQEKSATGRYAEFQDIKMMSIHKGGKERTGKEYHALMETAGFSHVSLISSPGRMDLVQAIKA
ncbi:unnamed protein product [Calypogeia fissa]